MSRMMYATLVDKKVVPSETITTWGSEADRRVGLNDIGEARVSTVFLGLNHNFGTRADQWFETMVFGGQYDQEQERYETWDQAEAGHKKWCRTVRRSQNWFLRILDRIVGFFG